MLRLNLPPDLEARLDALARRTGRTKSSFVREAISAHIEDFEDACIGEERLRSTDARTISWDEVRARHFGDAGDRNR